MYYVIYWDDDFQKRIVSSPIESHAAALNYARIVRSYEPKIVMEVAAQLDEVDRL